MSTAPSTPRRSLFGRAPKETGPRASLREIWPYLADHRRILLVVVILSVVGAATSLAQPLLVSSVISTVQAGDALG